MKKIIILFIMLYGLTNSYAQDCIADKVINQALEIDSLKRAYKKLEMKTDSFQKIITTNESLYKQQATSYQEDEKKYADEIQGLKKELSELEKYKTEKKAIDITIVTKSDSIDLLKTQITQKDNKIKTIEEKNKKDAIAEKEKGKNEVLNQLINTYKNKSLDDLIISSRLTSVQRDKQLIGNNTEMKEIITDLETYFNAEKLLSNKFNAEQVNNYMSQLALIKQQSKLVATLKDNLDNFKTFNEGLTIAIQHIILIDEKEFVKGMDEQIVKSKRNKIFSELSQFIFKYNFNFVDYPYLSDIVLEIIKRKQPNPDAEISDLLKKLE